MAGDLEDLERDLANGLSVICFNHVFEMKGKWSKEEIRKLYPVPGLEMTAKVLQERYVELQPLLKMPEDDIVVELEDLLKKVDEKLQLAGSFMRENSEMDSSTQKSGLTVIAHDRNLRRKLHDLSNQRQLLDTVQHIEGLLISCRSLSLSKIDKARSLIECENLLNEITKDDGPAILTGKIRDILREEVITMIDILKASLTYAFNEFVSYPTIDVKGTIHMRIRNSDPAVLVALHLFDELNGRLKKWASFIVKNFVQPIVDSGSGVDPYERFDFANGTSEFVGSTKIKPSVNPICLEGISSSLLRLFTRLEMSIKGIELNNRPLTLCLGNLLQEDVMMSFLKCITNAYPLTDPDESTLKAAMDIAERFREDMMKMHFFNDATPTFKEFSNEHFTMFIDRRCLEVLKKAKELITMPYLMWGLEKKLTKKQFFSIENCSYASFRPILSDSLWKIREIGADVLEQVLPEMVYSCTLGNVVSFLLDSISDVILRTEDIRSVDADISSTMIETLLTELIPVFTIKGQSSIHKSCSTAYFRMKEIIFCLKGSLQV
uniref:Centromere/kinetochore protein zw10 homolog n=1 Tax=Angiostrongylus cantonensis TaxID=6313 RepID=A0A158PC64_ANGCA